MDYYQKYLKYRTKYLQLKNQLGGAKCEICNSIEHESEECPYKSLGNAGAAAASGATGVDDNDGWEIAAPRRVKKERVARPPPRNISYDELVAVLRQKLAAYESIIVAGYVYGSRARGNNKPTSDADMIIFWEKMPRNEEIELKKIRAEIERELGIEIDFVSCLVTDKFVDHIDVRDDAYFDNIAVDAKQFIGETYSITSLIERSIKKPRLGKRDV